MARTRRRAWALTIAAATLAVVWVVSMRWGGSVSWQQRYWLASRGGQFIFVRDYANRTPNGLHFERSLDNRWYVTWWIGYTRGGRPGESTFSIWQIPLWPFILLTGIPGMWMLAKSRRSKGENGGANLCPACHYDLTGLPTTPIGPAPCPECGKR